MAYEGQTLMEVAKENDVDIEAACDGTCACSTCHVYVKKEWFDKLPEVSEDELDMLDLALEVSDTSRLSCQITLTKELDGIEAALPNETLNQYEWDKN
jgi:ferredoxin